MSFDEPTVTLRVIEDITYPYRDRLPENGILTRGCGLKSHDSLVSLTLTWLGNLLLINEADGDLLWSVRNQDISYVMMQADGQCIARDSYGREVWSANTHGGAHPYQFVCQNDGNLVIYGSQPFWASETANKVMRSRLPRRFGENSQQDFSADLRGSDLPEEILKLFTEDSKEGSQIDPEDLANGSAYAVEPSDISIDSGTDVTIVA